MYVVKKNRLTKLKINEISGVDKGANQGAKVAFWKRDENTGEKQMGPEQLEKALEDLEAKVEKLEAEKSELETLSKLSDEEKTFISEMDDEQKKRFLGLKGDERKKEMEKTQKNDAEVEAKTEEVLEKTADTAVEKAKEVEATTEATVETISKADFDALQKRADEQAEVIAKMQEEKAFNDFIKSTSKEVPSIASEAKAELAKSLFKMDEDSREVLIKELAASEKLRDKYLMEKGHSVRSPDDPTEKLDALAKSYAQDKGLDINKEEDFAKAYNAVCNTAEGKELYAQSLPN